MRCHWCRMHGAFGVIDTACTVHAVSLTPHAQSKNDSSSPGNLERAMQLNVKFKSKVFLSTPRYAAQRGVDFRRRL
jgi:hypothetical protein